MIESQTQFAVTLKKLCALLAGLEDLQRTVLPDNAALYAIQSESVMEDIRRLRTDLELYSSTFKVAS